MLCGVAIECHNNLQYLQVVENSLSLLWWTQGAHNCETYLRKGSESKLWRNCRALTKFQEIGSIGRRLGSGRPSKIQCNCRDKENYWRTNASGRRDYSPLAIQVADKQRLQDQSLYLLWCRTSLEWTFRGTSYWQLIHHPNKLKCTEWAKNNPYSNETIENIIFMNEYTLQLESHRRFCCHKWGELPRSKPRYNHASVPQSRGSWALNTVAWFSLGCSTENSAVM